MTSRIPGAGTAGEGRDGMVAKDRVLPPAFADRARRFVAERMTAVAPRPASTVVLLRDGAADLEVYVQVRQSSMPFAGGMLAFPGGAVDPVDTAPPVRGEGDWAGKLGTDAQAARAFVRAAIREVQEETRVNIESGLLHPWAHWVTPRFEPRRYDTWFFVSPLPAGAAPRDVSGEADVANWSSPTDVLTQAAQGSVTVLPPTRVVLEELATFGNATACLEAANDRRIETVLPGWIDDGDSVRALLPGDDEYPGDDPGDPS